MGNSDALNESILGGDWGRRRSVILLCVGLTLVLMLIANDAFSRAGSAPRGGASGVAGEGFRIIAYCIGCVVAAVTGILLGMVLHRKKRRSKAVILESRLSDTFWHLGEMEKHSKKVFLEMQKAWKGRDMTPVRALVSDSLYKDYELKLEKMRDKKEVNILNSITVKNVDIIGAEDFQNNEDDRFSVYIDGEMQDYMVNEWTGDLLYGTSREVRPFSDIYHFIRVNNQWILNRIDGKVTVLDVVMSKNRREREPV